MGKIKNALEAIGEFTTAMAEHNRQVNDLTYVLMSKTYDVDQASAEKIARVLIAHAEPIIWK